MMDESWVQGVPGQENGPKEEEEPDRGVDQSHSIMHRVLALHEVDLDSILGSLYDLPTLLRVIPEYRTTVKL